jgi:integrase
MFRSLPTWWGPRQHSAWPQAESPLLLLERQWGSQKRGRRLAAKLSPSVRVGRHQEPDGEKKRCHPHMFRDTFAVEMLLAGVPIDQVSLLLGHASVKITEKSYAPFVKATDRAFSQLTRQDAQRGPEEGRNPHRAPQCYWRRAPAYRAM